MVPKMFEPLKFDFTTSYQAIKDSNAPARVVPYLSLHSSHALSKAFEHRNFVARYQRESCVPGNYGS